MPSSKVEETEDEDDELIDDDGLDYKNRFKDPYEDQEEPDTQLLCLKVLWGDFLKYFCCPFNFMTKSNSITIQEGECGLVTKAGIYQQIIPPGFYYYNTLAYEIKRVSLRLKHYQIEGTKEGLLTNDNLTVYVSPVIIYKIIDPFKSLYAVQDLLGIMDDIASGILRRLIGSKKIEEIFSNPEILSENFKEDLNKAMNSAGVEIVFGGIFQLGIPPNLIKSMAQSAISLREAKANKIIADAGVKTAELLKETADVMNGSKGAVRLKYYETLRNVSENQNTTILLPGKMVYLQESSLDKSPFMRKSSKKKSVDVSQWEL